MHLNNKIIILAFNFSLACAFLFVVVHPDGSGKFQTLAASAADNDRLDIHPTDNAKQPLLPPDPSDSVKYYKPYYETGKIPQHNPVPEDDLGLEWQLPLRAEDTSYRKIRDIGGAYCPTMAGRKRGPWRSRYRGIHRGHDLGIPLGRLRGRKVPVHVVADGIYGGHRTYTRSDPLCLDCNALVVYHPSVKNDGKVYTSIYCHVKPVPDLKDGQKVRGGDIIGILADPQGAWIAHVHLEIYTRPVYSPKDSTKKKLCECRNNAECDLITRATNSIPRGCGIFEDDLYLIEPVLFIKKHLK